MGRTATNLSKKGARRKSKIIETRRWEYLFSMIFLRNFAISKSIIPHTSINYNENRINREDIS